MSNALRHNLNALDYGHDGRQVPVGGEMLDSQQMMWELLCEPSQGAVVEKSLHHRIYASDDEAILDSDSFSAFTAPSVDVSSGNFLFFEAEESWTMPMKNMESARFGISVGLVAKDPRVGSIHASGVFKRKRDELISGLKAFLVSVSELQYAYGVDASKVSGKSKGKMKEMMFQIVRSYSDEITKDIALTRFSLSYGVTLNVGPYKFEKPSVTMAHDCLPVGLMSSYKRASEQLGLTLQERIKAIRANQKAGAYK